MIKIKAPTFVNCQGYASEQLFQKQLMGILVIISFQLLTN